MASLAHQGAAVILCPKPNTQGLTDQQMFALHQFKHMLLSETFQLYRVVPPDRADPIIKALFDSLILDGDPTTDPSPGG